VPNKEIRSKETFFLRPVMLMKKTRKRKLARRKPRKSIPITEKITKQIMMIKRDTFTGGSEGAFSSRTIPEEVKELFPPGQFFDFLRAKAPRL